MDLNGSLNIYNDGCMDVNIMCTCIYTSLYPGIDTDINECKVQGKKLKYTNINLYLRGDYIWVKNGYTFM